MDDASGELVFRHLTPSWGALMNTGTEHSHAKIEAALAGLAQARSQVKGELVAPASVFDTDNEFHAARCQAAFDLAIAAMDAAIAAYKVGDLAGGDYYSFFGHSWGNAYLAAC
jgi:hypothetical protein